MNKFIANLLVLQKTYGKSPQILAWWVLVVLALAVLLVNFFLSSWLVALLGIIVFLGLVIFITRGQFRLAQLDAERRFVDRELVSIIQNLKDGILVYDPNFRIINLNRAAEEILKIEAGSLVGEVISPALVKNPRFRILAQVVFPSLAPTMKQISESGWPQVVDINLEEPSLRLRTTLNTIQDKEGKTLGFLKIIHDQTREEEILESKGEFITTAAHQLRTPLTAIHWAFESLTKQEDKADLKDLSAEGLKLAERTLKIVNDLLDAAKIEEGRFGYRFEEINLSDLIQTLVGQAKELVKEYGVKIYFSADKDYNIRADGERLGIALSNLIDNAIKYNTKNGSVTINVNSPEKNSVRIEIKDTGVGIPEGEIRKLFTKFYRGTNIQQIEPNGSGLGLYITKNIIENHSGKITLESVLGRGTTFWVILPLKGPSLESEA